VLGLSVPELDRRCDPTARRRGVRPLPFSCLHPRTTDDQGQAAGLSTVRWSRYARPVSSTAADERCDGTWSLIVSDVLPSTTVPDIVVTDDGIEYALTSSSVIGWLRVVNEVRRRGIAERIERHGSSVDVEAVWWGVVFGSGLSSKKCLRLVSITVAAVGFDDVGSMKAKMARFSIGGCERSKFQTSDVSIAVDPTEFAADIEMNCSSDESWPWLSSSAAAMNDADEACSGFDVSDNSNGLYV